MPPLIFDRVSKMYRTPSAGEHWVLRDISFECQEGEIVAILGRNGSGKSTCLKLAAGVTAPTAGSLFCARPVAPMLELGAGFHPDLTGRENIRLNATFVGLGRKISARLFDEIVAFAELEPHVDLPVKHYSSGMYARLGFAVAVHSPARVLLIDEVLAVGDSSFRQKCFDRILRLRDEGTTILFVSHDSGAIRQLCSRAMILDGARVASDGDPETVLHVYEWQLGGLHQQQSEERISSVRLVDEWEEPIGVQVGNALRLKVEYETQLLDRPLRLSLRIRRDDGVYCTSCSTDLPKDRRAGALIALLEDLSLTPGLYFVEASIADGAGVPITSMISPKFRVHGEGVANHRYEDGVFRVRDQWFEGAPSAQYSGTSSTTRSGE